MMLPLTSERHGVYELLGIDGWQVLEAWRRIDPAFDLERARVENNDGIMDVFYTPSDRLLATSTNHSRENTLRITLLRAGLPKLLVSATGYKFTTIVASYRA